MQPNRVTAGLGTVVDVCERIAESTRFQLSILVVIVANAVLIGFETYPGLVATYGDWFVLLDQLILGIFIVEILIRASPPTAVVRGASSPAGGTSSTSRSSPPASSRASPAT